MNLIDKVQKIREEVERIQLYTQSEVLKQILDFIDSLQEEPEPQFKVGDTIRSKHWHTAVHKITSMDDKAYHLDNGGKVDLSSQQLWELVEEPVSENLEEASKEWLKPQLDKSYADYGETKMMELTHFDGYAMLDAIEFGAKWQKEQFEKNRLAHCDAQTEEEAEIERDFYIGIIEYEHRQPTFDDAIKYGYHQAEKDLELTWEDVSKIRQIMFDYNRQLRPEIVENKASLPKDEEYCREVLNRFKKGKG